MGRSSTIFLFARLAFYAALLAGSFQWLVLAATSGEVSRFARDDGPLEIAQIVAAVFAATLFWLLSREREEVADLLRICTGLALVSVARELDNFTLELGSRHAYKLLAALPLGYALAVAWRARGRLLDQLAVFSRTPAFSLLLAGFLVIVVYSQILGQKELWIALLGIDDYRPVKDLVEESSELLGYLLLLFGAVEAAVSDQED
jgi:hypothetical protein